MPPSANVSHTWSATRGRGRTNSSAPRVRAPGHGRLQQVAVVVQLVAPLQVAVARPLAGTTEHRVEVAVGLLGRGDVRSVSENRSSASADPAADLPGHRLHQLVDVGVGEHHPLVVAGVSRRRPRGSCRSSRAAPSTPGSGRACVGVDRCRRCAHSPPVISTSSRPSGRSRPRLGATGLSPALTSPPRSAARTRSSAAAAGTRRHTG